MASRTNCEISEYVNPPLSALQNIIADILSKRRDLSEANVLTLIEEKKKEGRGLLSDEGAARLVAEELLVQSRGTELGRMQIKNLVNGLNDVSISGRVLLTWPPQQFQRRDGTPGRVMRLTLIDKSGRVRCALWDRHVDIASKTGNLQGRILRIGHAYTRQGLTDEPEVHAGDRSSIEIDPQDIPATDFPEFKDLFTQLRDLSTASNNVNTVGIVDSEPRYHTFAKDNRSGSLLRAILADQSGTIPLVAWNEKAEELRELRKGNILQIMNARTKLDQNARPELHVEVRSQVSILPSSPDFLKAPAPRKYKISELTGRLGSADITVSVLMRGEPREVKHVTVDETTKVSTIVVGDETGLASISLWDENAALATQVNEGETIELYNVLIHERLGELRLSLAKTGKMEKHAVKMDIALPVTKLNTLKPSKYLLVVEGTIADEPLVRQVVTAKGENVNVASFTIRDDTAAAKISVWREQVAQVTNLHTGIRVRITGVRVRPGLDQMELSTIPLARIELIDAPVKDRPAWEDIRHVIALEPGLSTWLKGVVLEVKDAITLSAVCEVCNVELSTRSGQFFCDKCGSSKTGKLLLSGRLRIDDGTGAADVILSEYDASNLAALDLQKIREVTLSEGKVTRNLSDEVAGLLGKEVEVYGTVEPTSNKSKVEFKARKIVLVPKR